MQKRGAKPAVALAAAAAALIAAPPAQAMDNLMREAQHTAHCLGLMLTDHRQHAQECLPNPYVPGQLVGNKSGSGVVIVVPPPPPPPTPEPCTACGACYAT